jgi:hypothetical protein
MFDAAGAIIDQFKGQNSCAAGRFCPFWAPACHYHGYQCSGFYFVGEPPSPGIGWLGERSRRL